jgi:hypothetical protein
MVFVALLCAGAPAAAQAPVYTVFDPPGAGASVATGINASGLIVGDFSGVLNGKEITHHGYVLSHGVFTEFDFPGSGYTKTAGVNDQGALVGFYRDNLYGKDHGYLLNGGIFAGGAITLGTFTPIDFPGADQTHAIGINDDGDITGGYCANGNECWPTLDSQGGNAQDSFIKGAVHGFVLLHDGTFVSIDVPGAAFTEVWALDRRGRITGRYAGVDGLFHVFQRGSDGLFRSIGALGDVETASSWYSWVGGVNETGEVASNYCTAEPCTDPAPWIHGFVLTDTGFTTIDVPGTISNTAFGLNALGDIVGGVLDASGVVRSYLRTR